MHCRPLCEHLNLDYDNPQSENIMKTHSVIILIHVLFLFFSACASTGSGKMLINEKEGTFSMEHNEKKRTGLIYIPDSYDGKKKFSLVFGLHGRGGSASGFKNYNFNPVADELEFIMVYPNGINGEWDISPGMDSENDDPGFFKAMIDYMKTNYCIDPERIYITGHSMGGYMAYRLAWDMSDQITAIAPVSGQMIAIAPDISHTPVSVLHVHALDDDIVPFGGNPLSYSLPASQSIGLWQEIDKCVEDPRLFISKDNVTGLVWDSESDDVDVGIVIYKTGGHSWLPYTTEIVSDFFYNHPKREVNIRIDTAFMKNYFIIDEPIEINAEYNTTLDLEKINNVSLFANGSPVMKKTEKPYNFTYSGSENGKIRFSLKVELDSGEIINSTNSPTVWITKKNLAVGAATLSSETEDFSLTANNAVDGDPFTRYSSDWSDPQWLMIDLGRVRTVDGFTLIWEAAYGTEYTIETSLNGKDWTLVYEQENGKGDTEFISIDPVAAQLVRLTGIKRATQWGYSLWEFMVHGK